ncbi:MAG TPA: DedA family protein [Kofleriaceae bacterium]|nr:DedA family protein [Kofleriaceae bacterium]
MTEQWLGGSIVLVFVWLVIGGLGVPLPEDAALLAAGVLIERGAIDPVLALVVVFAGVLGGDASLFFLARRLGPAAYDRKVIRRVLPPERRARIESAYRRRGGRLVFFARHVAGLRAAVFAMAGIHGMRPMRFLAWDAAAACLSIPFVVGLGYFGARHVERMRAGLAAAHHYVLLAVALAVLGFLAWRHVRKLREAGPRSPAGPPSSPPGATGTPSEVP